MNSEEEKLMREFWYLNLMNERFGSKERRRRNCRYSPSQQIHVLVGIQPAGCTGSYHSTHVISKFCGIVDLVP